MCEAKTILLFMETIEDLYRGNFDVEELEAFKRQVLSDEGCKQLGRELEQLIALLEQVVSQWRLAFELGSKIRNNEWGTTKEFCELGERREKAIRNWQTLRVLALKYIAENILPKAINIFANKTYN